MIIHIYLLGFQTGKLCELKYRNKLGIAENSTDSSLSQPFLRATSTVLLQLYSYYATVCPLSTFPSFLFYFSLSPEIELVRLWQLPPSKVTFAEPNRGETSSRSRTGRSSLCLIYLLRMFPSTSIRLFLSVSVNR